MGSEHQCAAGLGDLEHPGESEDPGGRVQLGGRLVGDEQPRLQSQRPGDCRALLLAAGELVHELVGVREQAKLLKCCQCDAVRAGRPAARSATSMFSAAVSNETRP